MMSVVVLFLLDDVYDHFVCLRVIDIEGYGPHILAVSYTRPNK